MSNQELGDPPPRRQSLASLWRENCQTAYSPKASFVNWLEKERQNDLSVGVCLAKQNSSAGREKQQDK